MYVSRIDHLPPRGNRNSKATNNSIQMMLHDFYNSDADYGEVNFDHGEYSSSYSLYSGIKKAIIALELPLQAEMISGGVYLRRLD